MKKKRSYSSSGRFAFRKRSSGAHCAGGCVVARTGTDWGQEKTSVPAGNRITVVQPVTDSLYWVIPTQEGVALILTTAISLRAPIFNLLHEGSGGPSRSDFDFQWQLWPLAYFSSLRLLLPNKDVSIKKKSWANCTRCKCNIKLCGFCRWWMLMPGPATAMQQVAGDCSAHKQAVHFIPTLLLQPYCSHAISRHRNLH